MDLMLLTLSEVFIISYSIVFMSVMFSLRKTDSYSVQGFKRLFLSYNNSILFERLFSSSHKLAQDSVMLLEHLLLLIYDFVLDYWRKIEAFEHSFPIHPWYFYQL